MALKPMEIGTQYKGDRAKGMSHADVVAIEAAEEHIDGLLRIADASREQFSIPFPFPGSERIREDIANEIERRYDAAGWLAKVTTKESSDASGFSHHIELIRVTRLGPRR